MNELSINLFDVLYRTPHRLCVCVCRARFSFWLRLQPARSEAKIYAVNTRALTRS